MAANPTSPSNLGSTDADLEVILTSFDSNYVWNYGSVKEGLRELYEKAKREQWNSVTQLEWQTDVDPTTEIIPQAFDPLADYAPAQKLEGKDREKLRHALLANQLSQFLHGEQGALVVASQLVGAVPWMDAKYYAVDADDGRSAPRRGLREVRQREARMGVPDQHQLEGTPRRDDHGLALGLQIPRHADHHRGPRDGCLRKHVEDGERAAAQRAASLRDERRVTPRRIRRARAAGSLPGTFGGRDEAIAKTSSSTPAN